MEEKSTLESIRNPNSNTDHGWHKVSYAKRQKKPLPKPSSDLGFDVRDGYLITGDSPNVFRQIEEQAEDRIRRSLESSITVPDDSADVNLFKNASIDVENNVEQAPGDKIHVKRKQNKPSKPKVTVGEAASKIDASDLSSFMAEVLVSYESQQEIQLMRFADYFGRAFASVSVAQFPWTKMFRESPIDKIADIPICYISEDVYSTSVNWISHRSSEALGSFILWALDSILADLAVHQVSSKTSKKVAPPASSKSEVALFVVSGMVLRRKPDVLIGILPVLRENTKYQGQDKLPVLAWMITQATQTDLAIGLFAWSHYLLPLVPEKKLCNPQSRDLILQLVERILSAPKASTILINGAVRKGDRLIPPRALDILMRITFPISSQRVKATDRFVAIYPTLKEVALTGVRGSKAMKQASQQILNYAIQTAGESSEELSNEAISTIVLCLIRTPECFKHWDKVYLDNLDASLSVLKRIYQIPKEEASAFDIPALRDTLKSFRHKNVKEKVGSDTKREEVVKESEKYCKLILRKVCRGGGGGACLKGVGFAVVLLAAGAAVLASPPDVDSWNWTNLSLFFTSHTFFY